MYSIYPNFPDLTLMMVGPYLEAIEHTKPERFINKVIQYMNDVGPHQDLWRPNDFRKFWEYLNAIVDGLENMLTQENITNARRFLRESPFPPIVNDYLSDIQINDIL